MEPKLIDLKDFILSGGGFMGESYNHRDNPEIMLKVYPLDWTRLARNEFDRAGKAYALGVPSPEPKDLVQLPDGRLGIIFQRIRDKKSFARAVGDDPSRTEELAARFAAMCKALHAIKVDKDDLPSAKEYYVRHDVCSGGEGTGTLSHGPEHGHPVLAGILEGICRTWPSPGEAGSGNQPYAALRALLVQRVTGRLIPERQALVDCLLD